MKPIAKNANDFADPRKRDCVYVDKMGCFSLIGLAFDTKTRQLVDATVERKCSI